MLERAEKYRMFIHWSELFKATQARTQRENLPSHFPYRLSSGSLPDPGINGFARQPTFPKSSKTLLVCSGLCHSGQQWNKSLAYKVHPSLSLPPLSPSASRSAKESPLPFCQFPLVHFIHFIVISFETFFPRRLTGRAAMEVVIDGKDSVSCERSKPKSYPIGNPTFLPIRIKCNL